MLHVTVRRLPDCPCRSTARATARSGGDNAGPCPPAALRRAGGASASARRAARQPSEPPLVRSYRAHAHGRAAGGATRGQTLEPQRHGAAVGWCASHTASAGRLASRRLV